MMIVRTVFALVLLSSVALASLGMSAGALDYGKVARGGEKTLSFVIVNGASFPLKLEASVNGELAKIATVSPAVVTALGANSQQVFNVTVRMPRDDEVSTRYSGFVFVSTEPLTRAETEGVGAVLTLAARKEASAEVGEEQAPLAELPWAYIAGGLALIIVAAVAVKTLWKTVEG